MAPYSLKARAVQDFVDWDMSTQLDQFFFSKLGDRAGSPPAYTVTSNHTSKWNSILIVMIIKVMIVVIIMRRHTKKITSEHYICYDRYFETYGNCTYRTLQSRWGGFERAWLITSLGEVTGLIWGTSRKGQCYYFTPIGLALEDIEKATGMEVELSSTV